MEKRILKGDYAWGSTSDEWNQVLNINCKYAYKRIFVIENTHPTNPFKIKYKVRFRSIVYESTEHIIGPLSLKIFNNEHFKIMTHIEVYVKNAISNENSKYKIDYIEVI